MGVGGEPRRGELRGGGGHGGEGLKGLSRVAGLCVLRGGGLRGGGCGDPAGRRSEERSWG